MPVMILQLWNFIVFITFMIMGKISCKFQKPVFKKEKVASNKKWTQYTICNYISMDSNVNDLKSNTCDEGFNQLFGNIISLLFTKENILSLLDKSNHRFDDNKKYLIKNPLRLSFVFKS